MAHFLHRLGCLHTGDWYSIGWEEQFRQEVGSSVFELEEEEGAAAVVEDVGGVW